MAKRNPYTPLDKIRVRNLTHGELYALVQKAVLTAMVAVWLLFGFIGTIAMLLLRK